MSNKEGLEVSQFLMKKAMENASKAMKDMDFEEDPQPVTLEDLQTPRRRHEMSRFVKNKAETEELLNENFNEPDEYPPVECIWCGRMFEAEDLVDWVCGECLKSNDEEPTSSHSPSEPLQHRSKSPDRRYP